MFVFFVLHVFRIALVFIKIPNYKKYYKYILESAL